MKRVFFGEVCPCCVFLTNNYKAGYYIFAGVERAKYYSQTDVTKKFKLSIKQYKELIDRHQLAIYKPVTNFEGFTVRAIYTLKNKIDDLNLPLKEK